MPLDDKDIWEYVRNQDQYIIQEFGLGIVGIGALFFAYGQINISFVKEIVAFVGVGGTFTLLMHMYGARKEYDAVSTKLKKTNEDFFKQLFDARSWRKQGWNKLFYYPVTRLMIFFMELVTWAWVVIILHAHNIPSPMISTLTVLVLAEIMLFAIYRRLQDFKKQD